MTSKNTEEFVLPTSVVYVAENIDIELRFLEQHLAMILADELKVKIFPALILVNNTKHMFKSKKNCNVKIGNVKIPVVSDPSIAFNEYRFVFAIN